MDKQRCDVITEWIDTLSDPQHIQGFKFKSHWKHLAIRYYNLLMLIRNEINEECYEQDQCTILPKENN